MTQTANFWDKIAVKYAASPIRDVEAYQYTLGRTRSYLSKNSKVLEIGCGTGSTALELAGDTGEILGTDISPEMMRIATGKAQSQGTANVTFAVHSAKEAIPEAKGRNAVLGFNILHLTEDLEGLLGSLHQTMAPGSLLITKTPCLGEPSIGAFRFLIRAVLPLMQFIGKAPDVRFLSFSELEALISDAGFKIIETGSYPKVSRYIVARRD